MKRTYKWLLPVSLGILLTGLLLWLGLGSQSAKRLTVYDSKGELLLSTADEKELLTNENGAYLDLALTEAAKIIANERRCSIEEARKAVLTEGFRLDTAFDSTVQTVLQEVGKRWTDKLELGCAITDLKGNVVAVYSTGAEENLSLSLHSPHSALKPLSVYGPALEKGILNWSSVMEDSPYSQLVAEDGTTQEWPRNANRVYTYEQMTVDRAIRDSVNTVSVKWLDRMGVSESISFLQENLQIPLTEEAYVAQYFGEQEVIGSLALGSLETGLSPVDMAGYYQIFANGGQYIRPSALLKMQCGDRTYRIKRDPTQVLSPGNADVMTKLMQQVVVHGTGVNAACPNVEVAGKTGTGNDNVDNWFVGITPGYSCALWHGQYEKNTAPAIFSEVITALYDALGNANRRFVTHENLVQRLYCLESGGACTPNCKQVDTGYYTQQDSLNECTIHKQEGGTP